MIKHAKFKFNKIMISLVSRFLHGTPINILWNTCTMEHSLGNTALMLLK